MGRRKRKSKLDFINANELIELAKQGYSLSQISKKYNVSRAFVYSRVKDYLLNKKGESILKSKKNIRTFEQRCGYARRWAYAKTKLICEQYKDAIPYFSVIWLAETLWLLDEWEKVKPCEKPVNNIDVIIVNKNEKQDILKLVMLKHKKRKEMRQQKKDIRRLLVEGYTSEEIANMLKIDKIKVQKEKYFLIRDLRRKK